VPAMAAVPVAPEAQGVPNVPVAPRHPEPA
jgi:hypothetical protein